MNIPPFFHFLEFCKKKRRSKELVAFLSYILFYNKWTRWSVLCSFSTSHVTITSHLSLSLIIKVVSLTAVNNSKPALQQKDFLIFSAAREDLLKWRWKDTNHVCFFGMIIWLWKIHITYNKMYFIDCLFTGRKPINCTHLFENVYFN